MDNITALLPYHPDPVFNKLVSQLNSIPQIQNILILHESPISTGVPKSEILQGGSIKSSETLLRLLNSIKTDFLLLIQGSKITSIEHFAIESLLNKIKKHNTAMVYSDFYEEVGGTKNYHPLNDYQLGSVRDDFDFGPLILFSIPKIKEAIKKYGLLPTLRWGALYDLRLKLSIEYSITHINDPLYTVKGDNKDSSMEKLFFYTDHKNLTLQREMETIFVDYLKKINAYIHSDSLKKLKSNKEVFPVEASVIIPVKNRKDTILEAIKSALSQKTDFPFNIIIIDNHSTDGTTDLIFKISRSNPLLKHIIPKRKDLEIGGCWNEALNSTYCGRYSIQLDSDDLYSNPYTLKKMVDKIKDGDFAMVVGSYCLVDSNLKEIPPGLIDHREWTEENGHNNLLRVNGIGAPRCYNTSLIRKIGFLNVSYGEDYAACLRITREFKIGRIYENFYLCRRWSGNSDSNLSLEELNQKNAFKDSIRTEEIILRKKMNEKNL